MTLSRREKYWVAGAVVLLITAGIFRLILIPMYDKKNMLNIQIESAENTLKEMYRLKFEYDQLQHLSPSSDNAVASGIKESLFSLVEGIAGKIGLKDEIVYMNPSTVFQKGVPYKISIVELKLEPISLKQLTQYLNMLETTYPEVNTRRLSVSRISEKAGLLSAVIEVQIFETQ